MQLFEKQTRLACSQRELFDWHARPEAFMELQPPWENVGLLDAPQQLHEGQLVRLQIRVGPLAIRWDSRITEVSSPQGFTDIQQRGPFAYWRHRHEFMEPEGGGCILHDRIEYRLPLGWPAELIAGGLVRQRLKRMFAYRHRRMTEIFGQG